MTPVPARAVQKLQRGQGLLRESDVPGGLKLIREAADMARNHRDLQMTAARTFHSVGRASEAIEFYRRCLKINADDADARIGLGECHRQGGEHEKALESFDTVLKHHPTHFKANASRAEIMVDQARREEALEAIATLSALPGDASKPLTLAILRARLSPAAIEPDGVIPELREVAKDQSVPARGRAVVLSELGRLEEKQGRHSEAFEAYAGAKRVFRPPWDADLHSRRVAQQTELWTEAWDRVPSASIRGPRIIFVLGMPRSGTTLVEQMLAQLEGVTPGGEQSVISQIVGEREMPKGFVQPLLTDLGSLTQRTVDQLAAEAAKRYALRVKQGKGETITDKQPGNYFYVPLILKLFPEAKIVHCVRDAMDVCLSNFATMFGRPHPETHDLVHMGRYYRDYERLMDAWRPLGGDRMHDAVYEDMIADTEANARSLVGFAGFEWTDSVLRFHESGRTVRTASREQVRQKIYTSSVKRHEKFGSLLDPLRAALGR